MDGRREPALRQVLRPILIWMTHVSPWWVRHLIYPMHERLRRRPTLARLRELERGQWRSPEEVRAVQAGKLRRLLDHARRHVPHYRRTLQQAPDAASHAEPHAVLRALPTLSKSQIRAALADLLWGEAPGGLHAFSTGGSTGEPLRFFLDRRRQASDQAARILTHQWFGAELGDRELWLWGSPLELTHTDRLKRMRDRLVNHRLIDAFNLSASSMNAHADLLRAFRPRSLFGYPSTLARWADHLLRAGEPRRLPQLRAVFVTGEVCDERQRSAIERCFHVPVADGYGSREAGFIAHECPEGGMHVVADDVIVEIDDVAHAESSEGWGEIVVTHLEAYGMPLIRYRTGDWGRLMTGRCCCGRGWPRIDRVRGRCTDLLQLPDGRFMHGLSVIYVLRETPGVVGYQVEQQRDHALDVRVVIEGRDPNTACERVRRGMRRLVRNQVEVRVRAVKDIPPTASGKHRPVVSHVSPNGGIGEVREGHTRDMIRPRAGVILPAHAFDSPVDAREVR